MARPLQGGSDIPRVAHQSSVEAALPREIDLRLLLLGLILVAGLIIGGSSVVGLPTTFAVQLASLPLLTLAASDRRAYGPLVLALVVASILLFVLQLLPLGNLLGSYGGEAFSISGDWIRTLDSLLFFLAPVAFFLVVGTLGENGLNRLVAFLLIGLVLNVALALVQFAASSPLLVGFLPYPTSAGFFANQNHFASLVFVGIPFVIYQFVALRRPWLSLIAVAVLVIAGFATRSVAGAFLSLGAAAVSYAVVADLKPVFRVLLVIAVGLGAGVLAFNPSNVLELNPENPLDRTAIWQTTLKGAESHLPMGSGFGTFEIAYPAFESEHQIIRSFANHAHNEYLEIALEGGLPATLLLLAYVGLLGRSLLQGAMSPLRRAAYCAIAFLLVHSLVDYPLRTIGLAITFGLLNGIVFSPVWLQRRTEKRLSLASGGE